MPKPIAIPTSAGRMLWHLTFLDALRGLAVLGVVLVHSLPLDLLSTQHELTFQHIAFFGQRGVQLFFLVSAFTLFLSYENRRHEHAPTRNFFRRGFFRLAPAFYLSVLATQIFLLRSSHDSPLQVALALVFLNGFTPNTILHGAAGGWSIADEAIFYMLLPLLFRVISSLRIALIWLFVAGVTSSLLIHLTTGPFPQYAAFLSFFGFLAEFPVFLLGIVAFFLWREFRLPELSAPHRRLLSTLLLFFLVPAFLAELPSSDEKLLSGSMLCAVLLFLVALHPWSLLVNRATIFLGKISFSIYLFHFYVAFVLDRWSAAHPAASFLQHGILTATLVRFGILLLLTLPLATLSWLYIEQPGIRLGRRLISLLEGKPHRKGSLVPPLTSVADTSNTPDAQF